MPCVMSVVAWWGTISACSFGKRIYRSGTAQFCARRDTAISNPCRGPRGERWAPQSRETTSSTPADVHKRQSTFSRSRSFFICMYFALRWLAVCA